MNVIAQQSLGFLLHHKLELRDMWLSILSKSYVQNTQVSQLFFLFLVSLTVGDLDYSIL